MCAMNEEKAKIEFIWRGRERRRQHFRPALPPLPRVPPKSLVTIVVAKLR